MQQPQPYRSFAAVAASAVSSSKHPNITAVRDVRTVRLTTHAPTKTHLPHMNTRAEQWNQQLQAHGEITLTRALARSFFAECTRANSVPDSPSATTVSPAAAAESTDWWVFVLDTKEHLPFTLVDSTRTFDGVCSIVRRLSPVERWRAHHLRSRICVEGTNQESSLRISVCHEPGRLVESAIEKFTQETVAAAGWDEL